MPGQKILIVDDSRDDLFLLQRTFMRFPDFQVLNCCEDGSVAVKYLAGAAPFNDRTQYPLPNVVLLDLKMPRMNGFEVLQWLRTRSLEALRVIIMTTSSLEEDEQKARALGADGYVVKGESAIDTLMTVLNSEKSGGRSGDAVGEYSALIDGRMVRASKRWIVDFGVGEPLEFNSFQEADGFLKFYLINPTARKSRSGRIYCFDSGAWERESD
jgi:CheY-like chemotaxis protein